MPTGHIVGARPTIVNIMPTEHIVGARLMIMDVVYTIIVNVGSYVLTGKDIDFFYGKPGIEKILFEMRMKRKESFPTQIKILKKLLTYIMRIKEFKE